MIPPYSLRVRIVEKDGKGIRLWLPLFLLWPLIPGLLLVAPVIWIAVMRRRSKIGLFSPIQAWGFCLMLISSLRGFRVDIRSSDEQVYISIK